MLVEVPVEDKGSPFVARLSSSHFSEALLLSSLVLSPLLLVFSLASRMFSVFFINSTPFRSALSVSLMSFFLFNFAGL